MDSFACSLSILRRKAFVRRTRKCIGKPSVDNMQCATLYAQFSLFVQWHWAFPAIEKSKSIALLGNGEQNENLQTLTHDRDWSEKKVTIKRRHERKEENKNTQRCFLNFVILSRERKKNKSLLQFNRLGTFFLFNWHLPVKFSTFFPVFYAYIEINAVITLSVNERIKIDLFDGESSSHLVCVLWRESSKIKKNPWTISGNYIGISKNLIYYFDAIRKWCIAMAAASPFDRPYLRRMAIGCRSYVRRNDVIEPIICSCASVREQRNHFKMGKWKRAKNNEIQFVFAMILTELLQTYGEMATHEFN